MPSIEGCNTGRTTSVATDFANRASLSLLVKCIWPRPGSLALHRCSRSKFKSMDSACTSTAVCTQIDEFK
eukprot:6191258-Pleurochrysis_carterae.AAC.1